MRNEPDIGRRVLRRRRFCHRIDFVVAVTGTAAVLIVNNVVDEVKKPLENDVERRAAQELRRLNAMHPSASRQ